MPTNWNNSGEQAANTESNGNDGDKNGKLEVNFGPITGDKEMVNNDFGINKKPEAKDVNKASQLNPGGTTQISVSELDIVDHEDGTPTTITIKTLPDNAILYYDGEAVIAGKPIPNFDPSKLTIDPIDGDQVVVFTYTATDAAGVESDPATVTMTFDGVGISGTLYVDNNGNSNDKVDGTPINKPDGQQLYINLIGDDGKVIASKPLADDGTYQFLGSDGVTANTDYTIVLSTTQGTVGNPAPAADLPANWNNTGENLNNSGEGNDGANDGKIKVSLGTTGIPKIDFGINKKPVAEDKTETVQPNPSGTKQYPVPTLPVTDTEDGTPTTITVKTLPDPTTGILYYDGTPVTAGQVIPNFDPSKLTVDPTDGNQVMVFTYTTTDEAGVESDPATVTMPFQGEMIVGDTVWMDDNGNGVQDPDEKGVEGVKVTLYDENGTIVDTATTDADGHYQFTVKQPGKYHIGFDDKYYYVKPGQGGDDAKDSNVDLETFGSPRTADFDLDWGDVDMTIDAGITPTAHIGDYFWIDKDKDGIQDPDEKPVPGATVELFDAQGNPVADVHGNHSVTTDANGKYGFDVIPGEYQVKFTLPPEGYSEYVFSSSVDEVDDAANSDADTNGFTKTIIAAAGENKLTLDAGINCGCDSVTSDGGDALNILSISLMFIISLGLGLGFIRQEEEYHAID